MEKLMLVELKSTKEFPRLPKFHALMSVVLVWSHISGLKHPVYPLRNGQFEFLQGGLKPYFDFLFPGCFSPAQWEIHCWRVIWRKLYGFVSLLLPSRGGDVQRCPEQWLELPTSPCGGSGIISKLHQRLPPNLIKFAVWSSNFPVKGVIRDTGFMCEIDCTKKSCPRGDKNG